MPLLIYLRQLISRGVLHPRTLAVGRRTNIFAPFPASGHQRLTRQHSVCAGRGATRTDVPGGRGGLLLLHARRVRWAEVKDVVIGRPGYDNYLVARAVAERGRVLRGRDERAGRSPRQADRVYNLRLVGSGWQRGPLRRNCRWRVEQFPRGWFALLRRDTNAGGVRRRQLRAERAWLRWIRPSDVLAGVLGELCGSVVVVVREGDYCCPANVAVVSRQRRRQERGVRVDGASRASGALGWSGRGVGGGCGGAEWAVRGDMAMDAGKVKEGGLLIVRGARLGEETERTYEVVGEMSPLEMLGKEFKGIVVYRKVHSET
ncbi:hypothetical protein WA556_002817 [Blastocystis sp. ATCC 50177/Nand II]